MQRIYFVSIAGLLVLAACNSAKSPNEANFRKAINEYLNKHGQTCTAIDRQFPVDVPRSEESGRYGVGPKLAALEQAGLVHGIDATEVVHSMLDPLRGPTSPRPVRRYEVTVEGRKYFQQIPGTLGQTSGFCYGQKSVDSIVKWTEPTMAGTSSQPEITYTYKILDLADWAQRPEIQQVLPDVQQTIGGTSKTPEVVGLQLTNKGWEVP